MFTHEFKTSQNVVKYGMPASAIPYQATIQLIFGFIDLFDLSKRRNQMNCEHCYRRSTQTNDDGVKNYCTKKEIVIEEEYYNQDHTDCCVCDGRRDGFS